MVVSALVTSGVTLVEDGRAVAEVVLPDKPNAVEKTTASELVRFIRKSSGAELKVVNGKSRAVEQVLIGRVAGSGVSAWCGRIEADAHTLRIYGGDDAGFTPRSASAACGTLFALYEFLDRELNIRFLWPDDDIGIVIDKKHTIAFDSLSYEWERPFESVKIRGFPKEWARRAARAGETAIHYQTNRGGHAFVGWWKTYAKTHPDFFEEMNGERRARAGASMCVVNPAFHAEIVRLWKEAREKNPDKVISINACENDTKGKCTCPLCKAWNDPEAEPGDASERYAHFYKALYELAAETDPSVRVYGYAYSNYVNPPRLLKLPENVCISFVPGPLLPYDAASREKVLGNIRKWQEVGCTLNYRQNIYDGYAMPEDILTDYYAEFQEMRKAHMKAVDVDGPNKSFATQGPFLYALSRLMVRPELSLEKLRDEYYSAFGPAKDAVAAYWEFWNRYALENADLFHEVPKKYNPLRHSIFFGFHYAFYAHRLFPQDLLERGSALLDKAFVAAKDSPDDLRRLEFLRSGLEHAKLCSKACEVFAAPDSPTDRRLAVLREVKGFRETKLPKWASDVPQFAQNAAHNEMIAWTFNSFDPSMIVKLPLRWKLKLDPKDEGFALGYAKAGFDDSSWGDISVESHLEKQDVEPGYKYAWYRTSVDVPAKFKGCRAVAYFRGVDEGCRIFLNGEAAGKFDYNPGVDPGTWNRPMEFDVTTWLRPGERNVFSVKLINEIANGGIWQPVELRFFSVEDNVFERLEVVRYDAGKTTHDIVRSNNFRHPGDKSVAVTFEYRLTGKARLKPYLREKEVDQKCLRTDFLEKLPPTGGAWTNVTLACAQRTLPEAQRLDLVIRAELGKDAEGEVRNVRMELR